MPKHACKRASALSIVSRSLSHHDKAWARKFEKRKIPIIGDDIKSQIGATIIHRALTRLFEDRGVRIDNTYQLNVGGNTDFLNMLNRSRLRYPKRYRRQRQCNRS